MIEIGIKILNFYERMAIGILKEVLDEDICYDDQGFILINFYKWTRSFIDKLKIEHEERRLFVNFEHIATRWTKEHLNTNHDIENVHDKMRNKKTIKNPNL